MEQEYIKGDIVMYDNKIHTIMDTLGVNNYELSYVEHPVHQLELSGVPVTPKILSTNSFKIVRQDESGALYFKEGLGIDIVALPYFTFKNGKLETTDNDWAYIPTLYKFEGTWAIDWIDAEESDFIEVIKGATPFEAAKNAYNWCVEKGYIKDTLNNK